MRSNTSVPNEIRGANQMTRNAATGQWMTGFARVGYAAKGVVYLIIGCLAAKLAIGQGGAATDQRGALHTIYAQPFGQFLLLAVAIGLVAFALWSIIQAIYDTESKGGKAKGIMARIGYAAIGLAYVALAFGAFQIATGTGSGGNSSSTSTQDGTATLLQFPFGVPLVVIIGLGVLGVACYLFVKAYQATFQSKLNLATVGVPVKKALIFLGRLGYGALGVVFTIIGIFLIVAALQFDPQKAKGLDTALSELLHLPFGPVLLGIVALGLIAYGVYSFVETRYRRLGRA
jgi:hypothetical protein